MSEHLHVLVVDDDPDIRDLFRTWLEAEDYQVATAANGERGLQAAQQQLPDLVLLDASMPKMSGYEFCGLLQERVNSDVPVVFVSALAGSMDQARAFAVGAVDYAIKPLDRSALLALVKRHVETAARWRHLPRTAAEWTAEADPAQFLEFKRVLAGRLSLGPDSAHALEAARASELYEVTARLGIASAEVARSLATFLGLPYVAYVEADELRANILPGPFCRKNLVLPVSSREGGLGFVLSNPLDCELSDVLASASNGEPFTLSIGEPQVIEAFFGETPEESAGSLVIRGRATADEDEDGIGTVSYMADSMILSATVEHASDIHIEPKEDHYAVRFRVDGDLREIMRLKERTGLRLVSRLKALGGMDIADRRKPQDGVMECSVRGHAWKLRFATTSTPDGEAMVIRLLDAAAAPRSPAELGMTVRQAETIGRLVTRRQGLVIVVGPTGSGKTTTVYSLLSNIDTEQRSLTTVEDPVEYRIESANQQQVNTKAGVTFESILRSVVRQDPDILFLGETRDAYSAQTAIDFASTGHLTITTLHTTDATSAIFRLERLGVTREAMSEALIAVIAQRLVGRLCPYCKAVEAPTEQEHALLALFTHDVPERVAHPVGCQYCNGRGYKGREVVCEIIEFDAPLLALVRDGRPASELRQWVRDHNGFLVSDHAAEKIRALDVSVADATAKVFSDELRSVSEALDRVASMTAPVPQVSRNIESATPSTAPAASTSPAVVTDSQIVGRVLLVEDDEDSRALLARTLEAAGHEVVTVADGADALIRLAQESFHLILSDINMPLLDGLSLLRIVHDKGLSIPVMLLTGSTSAALEAEAYLKGAVDYVRKPVNRDELVRRVATAMMAPVK